jgi:hypothetical protein
VDRLRRALVGLALPRDGQGRRVVAVDVSAWLRPAAWTSPDRSFCHVSAQGFSGSSQQIPGWSYSFVAALESGRSSWTAVLDVVRLRPVDDPTEVTAAQVREVVSRLCAAGRWCEGDPRILLVFDAGYDLTRLAWLLRDLPVDLIGRLRSDRVLYLPAPPRVAGRSGRPCRHGDALDLDKPAGHPPLSVSTVSQTSRHGAALADAWDRVHPKLVRRHAWAEHPGTLPIVEGTVIRVRVDRLPGNLRPTPMWLWASTTGLDGPGIDQLWRAYLRRFDLEHTFRLFKQTLGWTRPRLRDPAAADRWTWLIIAAYTQLRLARDLTIDLRRPWERPADRPGRLTPARVRRGFRHLRPKTAQPAGVPKPTRPGPGRPPGSKNRQIAAHPPIGKPKHQTTTPPPNQPQKV